MDNIKKRKIIKKKPRFLKKKIRFLVFERDRFTCQYCGRKPNCDDVILHVDHIIPVKKGGSDDMSNLVTSCSSCNLGKSARLIKNIKTVKDIEIDLELSKERLEQMKEMERVEDKLKQINKKIKIMNDKRIPFKERKIIRDTKIRSLYKKGYSMDQICKMENASKTTVFFAVNQGRSKKGKKINK